MQHLTPKQIVAELDKYIVGQNDAKRAVAVAVRNRWRRQQLPEAMRGDVAPKNILMIGPTGVGKTEIARRLAGLVSAPFIKVEATKYTEVGYHGRDVESMIRDLLDSSIQMVRDEMTEAVKAPAEEHVEEARAELQAIRRRDPDTLVPEEGRDAWEERLIEEGEGYEARVVATSFSTSVQVVTRARKKHGRDPNNGLEVSSPEVRAAQLRKQGLNQGQIARALGVSQPTVSRLLA